MDAKIFSVGRDLLLQVLGSEGFDLRTWIVLAVGLLTVYFVLSKMVSLFSSVTVSDGIGALVSLLGLALLLLGVVLVKLYLAPHIHGAYASWVLPAGAVLVLLAVVIPLTCKLFAVNYLISLGAWVITALATVLLMFVAAYGFDIISQGKSSINLQKDKRRQQERALPY